MTQNPQIMALIALVAAALVLVFARLVLVPSPMSQRIRKIRVQADTAAPQVAATGNRPMPHVAARIEGIGARLRILPPDMAKRLRQAGFSKRLSPARYLVLKLLMPIVFFPLVLAYSELVLGARVAPSPLALASAGIAALAFWAPDLLIKNATLRRKKRIDRGWPDALDLMHLCINAGMGLEAALAKVAQEIRPSYPDIADELILTSTELTYLQERRRALENLSDRTDIPSVREAVTTLVQSERYGTALGSALQTLARQSRARRLAAAEKKAATLPPKLTVPMIAFFLPALFVVIAAPAIIRLAGLE